MIKTDPHYTDSLLIVP